MTSKRVARVCQHQLSFLLHIHKSFHVCNAATAPIRQIYEKSSANEGLGPTLLLARRLLAQYLLSKDGWLAGWLSHAGISV